VNELGLSEWANIAEVIGALAVVVSLLYVGVQVRHNTNEVRASNRQQLIGRAHTSAIALTGNPEMAALMAKARAGDPLTPAEFIQHGFLVRAVLYDVQEAYVLNREGRLDDAYWRTRAGIVVAYLASASAREVYAREKVQRALVPDFIEWLDNELSIAGDHIYWHPDDKPKAPRRLV